MGAGSFLEPVRGLGRSAAAVPALAMVGVIVVLGAADGGYFDAALLPAALVTLALLLVALVTISTRAKVPRAVVVAVLLFAAYAAWSYLTILWAGDRGAAFDGANRSLLYALVFTLLGLWPLRSGPAAAVVGALGLGIAGLGVVTLVRVAGADDVSAMFVSDRLIEPLGYVNGNVALWLTGLFPCLFLAARREVSAPVRGLALGGAGLLAALAILGQSRGAVVALPLTLIVLLAITPGRPRVGVAVLAVAGAMALALDPILEVFAGSDDEAALPALLDDASRAIFLMAGALAVAGTLAALADRGVTMSPEAARRARVGAGVAISAVALAVVTAGVVALGDPVAKAEQAWEDFKAGSEPGEETSGSSRFTSAGSNRYDFWRVGLGQFADSPLIGDGVGSFQVAYLADGESIERPQFSHSLEVRLLSETGLVGTLLFAGGTIAALVAGTSALRRRSPLAGAAAAAGIATFAYWAIHGSVDWFYELPALGAAAFAMLGLACSLAPRQRLAEPRRPGSSTLVGRRAGIAAVAVAGVVGAVVLGSPWLAQRYIDRSLESWRADPVAALDSLDRAARLDPLSIAPHAAAAALALRLDRPAEAQERFEAVLERSPDDAYATLQLGALASELGRREEARRLLSRAAELSPRDELVATALRDARAGRTLDAEALYDAALERRMGLTGD